MSSAIDRLYTPRQQEILKQYYENDFFLMINSGSVRGGKTFVNNDIFLQEIRYYGKKGQAEGKKYQYICAGTSIGSFYRNVVMELNSKYGMDIVLDKYNSFELFGVKITVFGHEKINDLNKIIGLTAVGAYINEASKANKAVFDEILKRCSIRGARIVCDTNPESPSHWLYTDYILKADGKRIVYNLFLIDDNTFLDKDYIENVKKTTPSGVFYKRKILGEWCMAEGAIYEDFDPDIHYITYEEFLTKDIEKIYFGVDWGYTEGHAGCITVCAKEVLKAGESENNYYVIEEHAREKQGSKYWINKALEMSEKYKKFLVNHKIETIEKITERELSDYEKSGIEQELETLIWYCDHENAEKIDEFKQAGLYVQNANKSVNNGVEHLCELFKKKRMFIVRENVELFHREVYLYIWGNDGKPKKEHDNMLDSLRYALFSEHTKPAFWVF